MYNYKMETWRKIEEYDNYSVSDFGNVRNDKTNKILKPSIDRKGYCKTNLYEDTKPKTFRIHQLVAIAFIDNPDHKIYVDHIDNNRENNNIGNLRWCTSQENQRNSKIGVNNLSGTKGVSFCNRRNKWRSRICIDRLDIHLGYFDTIEEAKEARQIRANQAFGVFVNACEKL
jgi:hypothetical protein